MSLTTRTRSSRPAARLARRAALLAFALPWLPLGVAAEGNGSRPFVLHLKVADFDPIAGLPQLPPSLRTDAEPPSGIFVVQMRDAITPRLLARVRATGAEPLEYLPDGGYVVRLPNGAAAALRALPETRWLGALQPGWKIAPDLGKRAFQDPTRRDGGRLHATADLFAGEDPDRAAEAARALGADVVQVLRFGSYARLKLRAAPAVLDQVARIEAISWIEEVGEITPRNNTTRWVIQSNVPSVTSVWDHGIHGEGQIVGHIDGRLDINGCFIKDPEGDPPGPNHRKVVAYRSNTGIGADSHGTHTAGTAAGDQEPINGTLDSNGNAYAAKISHSNLNDITGSGTQPSNLYNYFSAADDDGARVHTNSWGDDGTLAYTTWCVDIDRFSWDREDSLVLFAVTNTSTLKTPENAKNCLAVGASQNGASADNFCSGGRGPTSDGRRKPEIFAPGCSIVSARFLNACSTSTLTGTSMASPAVTAAGALVRQYYEEGWHPTGTKNPPDALTPTGALVRATLLNSAVDMTGITGYPSNQEGWGRVLLERALHFDGETRKLSVLDDRRNAGGLSTGQTTTYALNVENSAEPLRITLVWTEPAASLLASNAVVNDLDLEVVSPTGSTYLGNVMDTTVGESLTGGSPDNKNNVEMVILGVPETGDWTVTVKGTAVNQLTQGYALVASGGVKTQSAGHLRYQSHQVQDVASGGNGDGIVDPGETVTMPVTLHNIATTSITGISGRLSSDLPAGVRITQEAASFPDLAADASGTSLPPHYRYTVQPDVPCGTRIGFQLAMASSEGDGQTSFQAEVGKSHADYPAAGLPVTIPKKTSVPVTSTVVVPDAFTTKDVNVAVDIGHGDVGEVIVRLQSPAGTVVTLHNQTGAGTADITTIYDRQRQPDGPGTMTNFDGQQAQGTWTLSIEDLTAGPTRAGTLRSWTLELDATAAVSCTPLSCADPVPGEVPPTLQLSKENATDVRLTWEAASGASSYRIWRASKPDFSDEALLGTTSATTFLDAGALSSATSGHYVVRAVNSCEWEGP